MDEEKKIIYKNSFDKNLKLVKIYSDGSCIPNPNGFGGWCSLLIYENPEKKQISNFWVGGENQSTNNKMELTAVLEGLKHISEPCNILIITDSIYVRNGIGYWLNKWENNNWQKIDGAGEIKNLDIWKEISILLKKHRTAVEYVKAHASSSANNFVDKKARNYAIELKKEKEKKDELLYRKPRKSPDNIDFKKSEELPENFFKWLNEAENTKNLKLMEHLIDTKDIRAYDLLANNPNITEKMAKTIAENGSNKMILKLLKNKKKFSKDFYIKLLKISEEKKNKKNFYEIQNCIKRRFSL